MILGVLSHDSRRAIALTQGSSQSGLTGCLVSLVTWAFVAGWMVDDIGAARAAANDTYMYTYMIHVFKRGHMVNDIGAARAAANDTYMYAYMVCVYKRKHMVNDICVYTCRTYVHA